MAIPDSAIATASSTSTSTSTSTPSSAVRTRAPKPRSTRVDALPAHVDIVHVYRGRQGLWHVTQSSGAAGGAFISEHAAVWFARTEARGASLPTVIVVRTPNVQRMEMVRCPLKIA